MTYQSTFVGIMENLYLDTHGTLAPANVYDARKCLWHAHSNITSSVTMCVCVGRWPTNVTKLSCFNVFHDLIYLSTWRNLWKWLWTWKYYWLFLCELSDHLSDVLNDHLILLGNHLIKFIDTFYPIHFVWRFLYFKISIVFHFS